jgi:hypothetical protein
MPATLTREACETLTALPTRTHPKPPYLPQPFPLPAPTHPKPPDLPPTRSPPAATLR